MPKDVTVVDHPLVQHKLTLMRDRRTGSKQFRDLLREIGMLLGFCATQDLPLSPTRIETPLEPMDAFLIEGKKLVVVSILRAGNGMLDGMLSIMPSARVGFVGLYRDETTLEAVQYYFKVPADMSQRDVILVDPMLATGHSATAALGVVKETGPRNIKLVCLVAAPEGIAEVQSHHPDVPIITAAVDARLNEKGYILPGLGDAGDRIFGT